MKYIRIKNDGLIDVRALHLLGASTKTNGNYIGQFGSGNKYALAYLIRNEYKPRIFSGEREIKISIKQERFRDHDFDVIYIDDERTSITTSMGRDWKFWQAIRELYCNAIDEGGHSIAFVSEIEPKEKQTHIYLDARDDAKEFVTDFDLYFAENKRVLFECEFGRILEKTGEKANIYRRGVRCYDSKYQSVYDYDFRDIDINEDRLVTYSWQIQEYIWKLIFRCTSESVIRRFLSDCSHSHNIESSVEAYMTIHAERMSDQFKKVLSESRIAPTGYAGLLSSEELQTTTLLPTKVFTQIRHTINEENVADKFRMTSSGTMYRPIDLSELQKDTIRRARNFLLECQYDIPYNIKGAIFDDKDILGCAHNGDILISDVCLQRGIQEVVVTIIEEFIHLKHQVSDKTRAFQMASITELVEYMKKINSLNI